MNSISASNYAYNDFSFSLKTSSGDTLELKMYDEKSVALSQETSDSLQTTTLSLSHAYGYSFSYQGDGIDETDKKEIDQALTLIQPMLTNYFQNVQQTQTSNADVTNKAFDINAYLPKTKESNARNYTNDSLLKSIDKILEAKENQNDKILKEAQKLFDALLKQRERFELYM